MSDNIPIEIQMEIIKKVSGVKSLVRFRSVSKPWKSFIDSSEFIKGYGARHTHPHSHILSLTSVSEDGRLICLIEDDNGTFKVQEQEFAPFIKSPMLKHYNVYNVVGACDGLLCSCGYQYVYCKEMLVIWNPSIGKSFGIVLRRDYSYTHIYGFGVCPVTKDPTVVKIIQPDNKPWHVEVFTLSSRVWNVIPTINLPHESIRLYYKDQVVIDRFIYWSARAETMNDDGEYIAYLVVSFDLITKEFKVVDLPHTLTNELYGYVSLSKLRESLVVYGSINADGADCCGVWLMERDSYFRKLFTIGEHVSKIIGFSKNGEPIFEIRMAVERSTTLNVYDLCSLQIKKLGISLGEDRSSCMGSYKESLFLLDHSDSCIY